MKAGRLGPEFHSRRRRRVYPQLCWVREESNGLMYICMWCNARTNDGCGTRTNAGMLETLWRGGRQQRYCTGYRGEGESWFVCDRTTRVHEGLIGEIGWLQ